MKEILEYEASPAVNQTLLKRIINIDDPEPERVPGRNKYMETGSIVDAILTLPQEWWKDKFLIVQEEKRPGETMDKIINRVYQQASSEANLYMLRDLIEGAIEEVQYKGNAHWTMQQRVDNVIKETISYWDFLQEAEGRTIVLQKEWDICSRIAENFKSSPNTYKYFAEDNFILRAKYQFPLYATLSEVDCKGLLDKCLFNERDFTIEPIDFKVTSASVREWKYQARRNRADIQASFYTALLKFHYPEWKVLPFTFLVGSANPAVSPYVYPCSPTDLYVGEYGATRVKSVLINEQDFNITREEEYIYGWRQALDIYKDAVRLGIEDFDLDSYFNNRTKMLELWS